MPRTTRPTPASSPLPNTRRNIRPRAGRCATARRCASSTCRHRTGWARPAAASRTRRQRAADDDPISRDPIGALATAAGYDDGESWWSDVIEENPASGPVFAAVADAMTALRAESKPLSPREAAREAHMRIEIAKAAKECDGAIAVVCGAWHVPALSERRSLAADRELLKGRPKAKIKATWAPWTAPRLARAERLWRGRGRARLVRASVGDARRRRSRRGVAGQGRVRAARSRTFRLDRLGDRGAAARHRARRPSRPPRARLRGIARGGDRLPVRRRARRSGTMSRPSS